MRRHFRFAVFVAFATAAALSGGDGRETPKIQDNSFLVEEAYNQEHGVVQHISTFTRLWNSRDWTYSFTEEWPGVRNWRHQFSYTIVGMHSGIYPGSGGGWGDVALNYRYQLVGDGDHRVAFAPRFSVLMPTGDVTRGRGSGAPAVQVNLPVSVEVSERLVAHSNVGGAMARHAQNADHARAATAGYTLAQSLIWIANPRVNLMLEVVDSRFQTVVAPGTAEWTRTTYLSPGVRWAYNLRGGAQIVPGVAMPLGIGASAGERGMFLYLSVEHPFRSAGH